MERWRNCGIDLEAVRSPSCHVLACLSQQAPVTAGADPWCSTGNVQAEQLEGLIGASILASLYQRPAPDESAHTAASLSLGEKPTERLGCALLVRTG